jgi:hypothetical protein
MPKPNFTIPETSEEKIRLILMLGGAIDEKTATTKTMRVTIDSDVLKAPVRAKLGIDRKLVTLSESTEEQCAYLQSQGDITIETTDSPKKFLLTFPQDRLELVIKVVSQWSTIAIGVDITKNPNYCYAEEVIDAVNQRFPMGAINRVDQAKKLSISRTQLQLYLENLKQFGREVDGKRRISTMADLSERLRYGNCGMLSDYGIGFLKGKYPHLSVDAVYLDDHRLLIIGLQPGFDPHQIKSWGKEALLVDNFANKIYPAHDFLARKDKEPNIPFYQLLLNHDAVINIQIAPAHYLSGKPIIYKSAANEAVNNDLQKWVQEDTTRLKSRDKPSPSIASSLPAALRAPMTSSDKETIKHFLEKHSGLEGWGVNVKTCNAWLEIQSPDIAFKIAKQLEATGALDACVKTKSGDKTPVVMCNNVEAWKLRAYETIANSKIGDALHSMRL